MGRLYREPPVLTSVFHLFIFCNFMFNIAWLFVFSVEKFWVAFVMLVLITVTLYAALIISHRNIYDSEKFLNKSMKYVWLYRALVNNGLAFYATWVSIASMLNFAIALTYDSGGGFVLKNWFVIIQFKLVFNLSRKGNCVCGCIIFGWSGK